MKRILSVALMVIALSLISEAVQVQVRRLLLYTSILTEKRYYCFSKLLKRLKSLFKFNCSESWQWELNSSFNFAISLLQEGEFSFSLESVKVLQQLTAQPRTQNPRLAKTSYYSVCASPTLPQEFVPLCMQKGATLSFARLGRNSGLFQIHARWFRSCLALSACHISLPDKQILI